jgi:hypothetical protein
VEIVTAIRPTYAISQTNHGTFKLQVSFLGLPIRQANWFFDSRKEAIALIDEHFPDAVLIPSFDDFKR